MKLYILFVVHKGLEEVDLPEALEVCDKFTMDINPEWMQGKLAAAQKNISYSQVALVEVEVNGKEIWDCFSKTLKRKSMEGKVMS